MLTDYAVMRIVQIDQGDMRPNGPARDLKEKHKMQIKNKSITKIVELTLNGFHGLESHNVRATFSPTELVNSWGDKTGDGYRVTITESAAKKFGCRCSDCTCGEGVPTVFECDQIDFDCASIEISGNYPQR